MTIVGILDKHDVVQQNAHFRKSYYRTRMDGITFPHECQVCNECKADSIGFGSFLSSRIGMGIFCRASLFGVDLLCLICLSCSTPLLRLKQNYHILRQNATFGFCVFESTKLALFYNNLVNLLDENQAKAAHIL